MTLYTPQYDTVEPTESVVFDGSSSSTSKAITRELSASVTARVYLERKNQTDNEWEEITQFDSQFFTGKWHTNDIQTRLIENERRIRVVNTDDKDGYVEVVGDEL